MVSPVVRFDCNKWLKRPITRRFQRRAEDRVFCRSRSLFKANAHHLPTDNTRPPKIMVVKATTSNRGS